MPELPTVTGAEAIRAFAKVGFGVARIKGSHHILSKQGHPLLLTVPVHGKQDLPPGLLRSLIRAADLTVQEFVALLD